MANIKIKINMYFTTKRPDRVVDFDDGRKSAEALWFTSADVLEYIESTGVEKDSYIGLLGYESLYITPTGKLSGTGALKELALAINDEESGFFKKVFADAKEIYLQSQNVAEDKLYQFSEEDSLKFISKIFSNEKYNVTCEK